MGTTTWGNCTGSKNSNHSNRGLILIALFIAIFALGVSNFALGVVTTDHAEKHDEAQSIRNCLDRNGPYMIMRSINDPTWYLLCQIDKTHWGVQAVTKNGIEKTAFSPGDGSFKALMDYMNRIAIRFKGTVPWMQ